MGKGTIKISRLELYKQVWETPIIQLSKEYGLSDVGFAKICKKHNIPRPPRGYWARKAAGQRLQRDPLPQRSSYEVIEIRPNLLNQITKDKGTEFLQEIESKKSYPPIVVTKTLRSPHPILEQSIEILELCTTNDAGIIQPEGKGCLNIRVSKKNLRRALRILDALIKGLSERGFEVYQEDDVIKVKVLGETLGFGISEDAIIKKVQPEETNLDGHYHFGHSRFNYDHVPSGKLCITIIDRKFFWRDNFRKNWRDTDKKDLESSLDAFISGLIKRAAQRKELRRQKEEEERERQVIARQTEEAERQRAERERKIQLEKERVAKLINDAENYQKSKLILDFIAAVERERLQGNTDYVSGEDYYIWLQWAKKQADRLDPLKEDPDSSITEINEGYEDKE